MGRTIDDYDMNSIIRDPVKYAKKLTVAELEDLIRILKDHYYNDSPLVPDLIYDQLEDVLRERAPKSKALQTGAPVKGVKEKLPYPMASQNKAKMGAGTVETWLRKYKGGPYVVSHKIDGISLMYYRKGGNVDAGPKGGSVKLLTRGNGEVGTNVTQILKYIDIGNLRIPKEYLKDEVAIRGELIMTKEVWDKKYADNNPSVRNYVAGAVNSSHKHPEPLKLRDITFVAYQLVYPEMKPSDQFKTMNSWKFHVAPHFLATKLSDTILNQQLDRARETGPYQIDGLVISYDSREHPDLENPKMSIAYKNQTDEVAQTKVIQVIWRGSKKARIKPTVVIEPVFLSGGTLSRATAHYAKYVLDNKIGPGALVTIVRSGDVIPYIISVDKPAAEADMPDFEYEWTDNGLDIYVTEDTDEILESRLSYMAKALDIEFLGPGTVKKLVAGGFRTPVEFLRMNLADFQSLDLGKMAEKIWNSMVEHLYDEGVGLAQLMDSTSIFDHGIGKKKIQKVLDEFPDLIEKFEETDASDSEQQDELVKRMIKIKGIERKTAERIVAGLPEFVEFLDQIPHIKIREFSDDTETSGSGSESMERFPKLEGLRVIFTGVRDKELEKLIEGNGGLVATGVSKTHKNQVVVAKDPSANSNKIKTAKDLGIPVLTLEEFQNRYLT